MTNPKKILVITGDYHPFPSANGVCLDQILKDLYYRCGFFSVVIGITKSGGSVEKEYCSVNNIAAREEVHWTHNLISNTKSIKKVYFSYPLDSYNKLCEVKNYCFDLLEKEKFEFVLCVQKPANASYIGLKIKGRYKEIPVILYELDSLVDNMTNYSGWKRYFKHRNIWLENRVRKAFDYVICLNSHAPFYSKEEYKEYRKKTVYTDVPLLDKKLYMLAQRNDLNHHQQMKFLYSGTLYREERSPLPVINLIKELGKTHFVECMFYARGSNVDIVIAESEKNQSIKYHDYIPKEELDSCVASADFLVNIGNAYHGMVSAIPSKLVYYLSFGKPIIHFAYDRDDLCIQYLKKYPCSLVLFCDDSVEVNSEKFVEFYNRVKIMLRLSFEDIEKLYPENTPQYTTELIMSNYRRNR